VTLTCIFLRLLQLPTQRDLEDTYIREFDKAYGPTYTVLDLLQQVFFHANPAREAFVELCESEYVQKVTFDSYLYKKVQGNDPVSDIKLLVNTVSSLIKQNLRTDVPKDAPFYNPVESLQRL
jgi:geranylgeranyl reductase